MGQSTEKPSADLQIQFDNSYARLPDRFYARIAPTPVVAPVLIKLNEKLAEELGLKAELLESPEGIEVLAGNRVATGSKPLAMAYAGHQFGNFVRQLGDGRANLLGEVIGRNGARYDLQLKGAGRTPFSRNGDGRAALGPVLREYVVSEAMAAMGIPTTRALAAISTGQAVFRETPLPGAVLTRVAESHLRVGTFQYFFAQGDVEAVRILADYAIKRHYPSAADAPKRYRAFLEGVIERQAKLVAQWMLIGFIHGVMNTDNTSISGETIDYGPCAFMEAYDPRSVFSSIDRQGRYAFSNQPHAMHWNLARLAESILPLLIEEEGNDEAGLASAYAALEQFGMHFESARNAGLRRKMGLTEEQEGDLALAEDLLQKMAANHADYTLTFRRLCDAVEQETSDSVRLLFADPTAFDAWALMWKKRLSQESISSEARTAQMRQVNPIYIPRNHQVEAVIRAATEHDNLQPFHELVQVLEHPYLEQAGKDRYSVPARPEEHVTKTFCGT